MRRKVVRAFSQLPPQHKTRYYNMFFALMTYILSVHILHHASCTELTVTSYSLLKSPDRVVLRLPTFECHTRHTGYKELSWYKDDALLKKGSTDMSDHFLSLEDLLNTKPSTVNFTNSLKLQGYYWCQTDLTKLPYIHKYLFRIQNVNTFVGKLIATRDSLGDHEELSFKEKLEEKMEMYEKEMQDILFGFLIPPNVFVHDMRVLENGLDVRFYVYARAVIDPRKPTDNVLMNDHAHLEYVELYLRNQTETDPQLYYNTLDWADFRGVQIEKIQLKSTLGCYEEITLMKNSTEEIIWPYARIGDVVIPENACSSNNGLSVTRLCTGDFSSGATWGVPSGKCEKPAEGITRELKQLHDDFGNLDRTLYIEKLKMLTDYPSELTVTDLHITAEILKALSRLPKLKEKEISNIVSVIDKIVEVNQTELHAAKSTVRLTSRILKIFDIILESVSEEEKEIQIPKKHILVDSKYTNMAESKDHVLGLAVRSPHKDRNLKNGSVEFLLSSHKVPHHDSIAYFTLPLDLIEQRESHLDFPCQVSVVFFREWDLFQNPKGVLVRRNYKVIQTPVMYVSISGGPAWNLTDPVQLYFKDTETREKIEDPVCVYYDTRLDDGAGAWSSEGCEYGGLKSGLHVCRCHHLSIFAVILSHNPEVPGKLKLGTSVYVGCGVSILALSFAVLLFILSKHWRSTVDHKILFCLALSLLVCLILIFISEMHFLWIPGCMVLALLFQYTVFAIFGWLLVHAVVYQLRFSKKTDLSEIPHFIIKAALSVWGSPIIIVMIVWFAKEYSFAGKENCWLTVSEVSMASVIPVALLMLVTLCVNTCATYALTCRFKKDFLIGDSEYTEPVLKFRVSFTIFLFFVISWLFGFFALHKRSTELRILFSISITLTAYYITLFFIFQEISLWDLCRGCKKKEEEQKLPTSAAVKYVKQYKSAEEGDCVSK